MSWSRSRREARDLREDTGVGGGGFEGFHWLEQREELKVDIVERGERSSSPSRDVLYGGGVLALDKGRELRALLCCSCLDW
jgi:hypothetical protein